MNKMKEKEPETIAELLKRLGVHKDYPSKKGTDSTKVPSKNDSLLKLVKTLDTAQKVQVISVLVLGAFCAMGALTTFKFIIGLFA